MRKNTIAKHENARESRETAKALQEAAKANDELINSILLQGAARYGLLPKGIQLNWPAARLPMSN